MPMNRLPAISLVTPSLNQGKFIRSTIESVLAQDYPAIEYFVQDGGSTDGTLEVLKEYADRVPFVSEKDRGQADAINRGLGRTTGEVLGYLNSDDVLLPGALRAVGEVFASDPDLLFVFGRARYIDEEGKPLAPYLTRPDAIECLSDACFIAQPAAFFRRSVWNELGTFDESLHHTMDYDYWLRFGARYGPSRARYIDRELAGARMHADAKTVAGWSRALEEIMDLVKRRTGYVSLWWCVAKADHEVDGRSQATDPHPVPWRAYPRALVEFLRRNPGRSDVWLKAMKGMLRRLLKRIRAEAG
jgi:glycosyltransferase involved in cell wall biosynthesis